MSRPKNNEDLTPSLDNRYTEHQDIDSQEQTRSGSIASENRIRLLAQEMRNNQAAFTGLPEFRKIPGWHFEWIPLEGAADNVATRMSRDPNYRWHLATPEDQPQIANYNTLTARVAEHDPSVARHSLASQPVQMLRHNELVAMKIEEERWLAKKMYEGDIAPKDRYLQASADINNMNANKGVQLLTEELKVQDRGHRPDTY